MKSHVNYRLALSKVNFQLYYFLFTLPFLFIPRPSEEGEDGGQEQGGVEIYEEREEERRGRGQKRWVHNVFPTYFL
jgi:hypothetical protein